MALHINIRRFLAAFDLDYLPENNCPPAFGFRVEKPPEKPKEIQPENTRKVRPGFAVDFAEEQGNVKSAWKAEKYDTDTELTEPEKTALRAAGLSLQVARVVKVEKMQNRLSNQAITDLHHVAGRRDGFGRSTIDKIATIVAPSTDRGAKL